MFAPISYQRWQQPKVHPFASLPSLLGEMFRGLASGSIDQTMIASQLVAHASLLTQGAADVAWLNGLTAPVSINVFLVAPSGAGKSLVQRVLVTPIHLHLRESARRLVSEQKLREVDEQKRLDDSEQKHPDYFIEDATRSAIIEHLVEWPVAGLFTDEAGQLTRLLTDGAATLAKLSDGAPLRHARVTTGRVELIDRRLTMLLMEQPDVFEGSKVFLGAKKGGIGLINRFCVGLAQEMPNGPAVFNLALPADVRARYEERVRVLLDMSIGLVHAGASRPVLILSGAAQRRLTEVGEQMRSAAKQDARFASASEYVSRHSERVLRLAAVLHVFDQGVTGEVGIDSVEAAHQIDVWSIEAYVALTHVPETLTQVERDAARIEAELKNAAPSTGLAFPLAALRRQSPNIGMTKARFDRALALLAGGGKVWIQLDRRGDLVWLQPSIMSPLFVPRT